MATTLRTRIVSSVQAIAVKTVGTQAPAYVGLFSGAFSSPVVYDWPNGTGTGQASKAVGYEVTLAAGGSVSIDLSALEDAFGDAVNFTKVKAFQLSVLSGAATLDWSGTFNPYTPTPAADVDAHDLVIGDLVSVIRPAGITISGSNKTVDLDAFGSGTVTVRIIIVGD